MRLAGTTLEAGGAVQIADLLLQRLHQLSCGFSVLLQVQIFDFPVYDPPGHGVDVVPQHVAPHPVGLNQRGPPTHEGVGDGDALEVVGGKEGLLKRTVAVFGEDQATEQGSRSAGEPLVYGDDGPVVLLDLFFLQGQGGDEGDVEVFFYGHGSLLFPLITLMEVIMLKSSFSKPSTLDQGVSPNFHKHSIFGRRNLKDSFQACYSHRILQQRVLSDIS